MDTSDIPVPSDIRHAEGHDPAPTRCTIHVFRGSPFIGVTSDGVVVKSGSPACIAKKDWPPAVLFDAVYASLVLNIYGEKQHVASIRKTWQHRLSFGLAPETPSERQRRMTNYRRAYYTARTAHEDREEVDPLDLLFLVPFMAVPPQQLHERWEEARMQQEMATRREAEEKVCEWLKNTTL